MNVRLSKYKKGRRSRSPSGDSKSKRNEKGEDDGDVSVALDALWPSVSACEGCRSLTADRLSVRSYDAAGLSVDMADRPTVFTSSSSSSSSTSSPSTGRKPLVLWREPVVLVYLHHGYCHPKDGSGACAKLMVAEDGNRTLAMLKAIVWLAKAQNELSLNFLFSSLFFSLFSILSSVVHVCRLPQSPLVCAPLFSLPFFLAPCDSALTFCSPSQAFLLVTGLGVVGLAFRVRHRLLLNIRWYVNSILLFLTFVSYFAVNTHVSRLIQVAQLGMKDLIKRTTRWSSKLNSASLV